MLLSDNYNAISPKQAKEMMSENDHAVLLDVREGDEYRYGHIAGSRNIPVGSIMQSAGQLPQDKDAPIIVYCLSGVRAKTACKMLEALGYTNLYDLGGINTWPYEIVK